MVVKCTLLTASEQYTPCYKDMCLSSYLIRNDYYFFELHFLGHILLDKTLVAIIVSKLRWICKKQSLVTDNMTPTCGECWYVINVNCLSLDIWIGFKVYNTTRGL